LGEEGSDACGNELEDDDYDDNDLDADFLADLPTDVEAAAEQSALMASFETQYRDQSVRRLMVDERRAAADRLGQPF
jgi:hypothetical protein